MMLLLIKFAFGVMLVTLCSVALVRWWLKRHKPVITYDYARANGELLSWRQALSARIEDPLISLVPLHHSPKHTIDTSDAQCESRREP